MNYEELVKIRKNIGDMTKEELFTYCGGLLSEVWDYEKENIDLQNRFNSLIEAHKNSEEEIERLNNIIKRLENDINITIKELFNLKDMIYEPETREINFDVQRKISSIIKNLGSDKSENMEISNN